MIRRRLIFFIIFSPFISLAKEQKIGFVESSKIFAQYQATSSATQEFNDYVNACRDSAAKLQQNIQNLKNEFEAQKLMLSEDARLKKLEEIEKYNQIYNQYLQDVFGPGGKIEQKNDELMAPLMKKINDAIAKVAQQEGFSMILDLSEGIFYASPELNITELVINELNREYGVAATTPGAVKKYIGIFPLKEENSEAMAEKLGLTCQNELYNVLNSYAQTFNIVSKGQIIGELNKRQWNYNMTDENQIIQIAKATLCNYIVKGSVSKIGNKIDYTLRLIDVSSMQEIKNVSNTVTDDIKFSESLRNDLINLIEALKQKE
uniref:OmpH family outer membrane protein n=1 Tax=candidate division WOR-3 bacterium TaxID=2052148 RepID=A0A7V3VTV0_UNCW3